MPRFLRSARGQRKQAAAGDENDCRYVYEPHPSVNASPVTVFRKEKSVAAEMFDYDWAPHPSMEATKIYPRWEQSYKQDKPDANPKHNPL